MVKNVFGNKLIYSEKDIEWIPLKFFEFDWLSDGVTFCY